MSILIRCSFVLAVLICGLPGRAQNNCLNKIFKTAPNEKEFHSIWPFAPGAEAVGTLIINADPKIPGTHLALLDAPDFRPVGATALPIRKLPVTLPRQCLKPESIPVATAMAQLADLSQGMAHAPTIGMLHSIPNLYDSGRGAGIDFSQISIAFVTVGGLSQTFLDVLTLGRLDSGNLLNPHGTSVLDYDQSNWLIDRTLRAEKLKYILRSDTDIPSSFATALMESLPGFNVAYLNSRAISLTASGPVLVGYTLWRRSSPPQRESGECGRHGCELGASEIDRAVFVEPRIK